MQHYKSLIGSPVIVRSVSEGVNFGYLVEADSTGCVIRDARRLRDHAPNDKKLSWFEGVALSGLDYSASVTAPTVPLKVIVEDYSLTVCTQEAAENIANAPTKGQS